MTNPLQTILADPELRVWPTRNHTAEPDGTHDLDAQNIAAESNDQTGSQVGKDVDAEAAISRINALLEPASEFDRATNTAPNLQPAAEVVEFNTSAPADYAPDPDAQSDEDSQSPLAEKEAAPPRGFDAIAAKPNAVADKIAQFREWLAAGGWKNPRTLGSVAAVAVVLVTLALSGSGDDPAAPSAQIAAEPPPIAQSSPGPAAASVVTDVPLGPESVLSATARCPAPSSDPMNALRPDSAQPWVCVRAWQVDGQLLEIIFDRPYVISSVGIMPGASTEVDGQDQWVKYRTVSRLTWSFNDPARTKVSQTTGDRRELMVTPIVATGCSSAPDCPVIASAVTITIEKTSEPSNPGSLQSPGSGLGADYTAFAVSHLEIVGHPAG
ncbi:hypothetical protein [Mycobacterium sp. shizuoka-1]|uniref:hypothetical protein n=1 Tax=Mycobacterium sp. shizuoka-1 TaxID=2039281 RepID=UPI000C0629D5|nr:hypothetical protein [Mycobacterium sp. shizuoka-1]GAY17272.1 hypothetical protein MSZK_39980 [Mycobacterium sp. shizuoka-1]